MGLSLLNSLFKSNLRICKPKLLRNYFALHTQELRCNRLMSNYLHKKPIEISKKVSNIIKTILFSSFFSTIKLLKAFLNFIKIRNYEIKNVCGFKICQSQINSSF